MQALEGGEGVLRSLMVIVQVVQPLVCPGVLWGDQRSAAQRDGVAIMENAIYLGRRKAHIGLIAVGEVALASVLDHGNVSVHDVVLCAGQFFDGAALPTAWSK